MGSGFRTFQSGEVLTASNVQNYLMDQSVQVFAGTAALGSAIGTAVEPGMVAYLTDSDQIIHYRADASQGTAWQAMPMVGGSNNRIINGGFNIWQRATSYTIVAGNYGAADRWIYWHNGSTAGTQTVSRQAFTAGAAPVAGYEAEFFQRITTTTIGSGQTVIDTWQRIEGVRTLAGQTVNVSFWAKTSGTFTITAQLEQNFGSGGSSTVTTTVTGLNGVASSGSWTRYTGSVALPSISGKTIGANDNLMLIIRFNNPTNGATFDLWGVQVEAGSVATPFEVEDYATTLAKCQRYYINDIPANYRIYVVWGYSGTESITFPTTMRAAPTISFTTTSSTNLASIGSTGVSIHGTGVLLNQTTSHTGIVVHLGTLTASVEL